MSPLDIILLILLIVSLTFQAGYFLMMKRNRDILKLLNNYENVKAELQDIINDAEQMVYELNELSDYIVRQMDLKNTELQTNIKNAEEQLNDIAKRANSIRLKIKKQEYDSLSNEDHEDDNLSVDNIEKTNHEQQHEEDAAQNPNYGTAQNKKFDIGQNQKYSDVLKLMKEGMDESEIARRLKIGKGEIRLILGLNNE